MDWLPKAGTALHNQLRSVCEPAGIIIVVIIRIIIIVIVIITRTIIIIIIVITNTVIVIIVMIFQIRMI